MTTSNQDPLIVIVGETASGKSAMSMYLARQFKGEIISADSWAVYKGFDIGTAKPSQQDRAVVPHHLIDVADPNKGFNAVLFKKNAMASIIDITKRGKLPILVGGTGLYIDSILYDYSFLPASDPKLRQELNSMNLDQLLARAEAMELDTDGIDLRNKRRVIRLIENNGVRPTKKPMRDNTLILGVTRPRDQLESRVEKRIDAMVEAGFPDEVRELMKQYSPDIEAFRAPGYRAFKDYVDGKITLEEAKFRFRQNDLQLAKKQRTWFKRNKSIHWISDTEQAIPLVNKFLNK